MTEDKNKRKYTGIRILPTLREKLRKESKRNYRSLSKEIEIRLLNSFKEK